MAVIGGGFMNWLGRKPAEEGRDSSWPMGFDDYDLRLGDVMRGERATLGKSLLDVQRELHIRATYITAIENGDLSVFEAPSFVAGYVRSYAKYLGMDPEWTYAKFCAETGFAIPSGMDGMARAKTPARPAVKQVPDGLLNRLSIAPEPEPFWRRIEPGAVGSIAVLVALIAGLGYGGWTVFNEVQRVQLAPADQAPNVLSELDPLDAVPSATSLDVDTSFALAEPAAMEPLPSTRVAEGSVRVHRPQGLDVPVMESRDGPIAAITPRRDTEATPDEDDAMSRALAEALAPENRSIQVVEEAPAAVELLAVRPSWVRVRAADGTVLFEKILDAGERYTVPQTEDAPILRAGNSGSVYFMVNGQAYGPAAPGAQMVDQVALSAEGLRERFETADLSRDADLERFIALAEAGSD